MDCRLICLQQERLGRKQSDIPTDQITRIEQTTRFRSYRITVQTTSRTCRIRIAKDDAFRFARARVTGLQRAECVVDSESLFGGGCHRRIHLVTLIVIHLHRWKEMRHVRIRGSCCSRRASYANPVCITRVSPTGASAVANTAPVFESSIMSRVV
jgi:hypothetical protein